MLHSNSIVSTSYDLKSCNCDVTFWDTHWMNHGLTTQNIDIFSLLNIHPIQLTAWTVYLNNCTLKLKKNLCILRPEVSAGMGKASSRGGFSIASQMCQLQCKPPTHNVVKNSSTCYYSATRFNFPLNAK